MQLAERIGVTQRVISRLELGATRQPYHSTCLALAAALEVDAAWLVYGVISDPSLTPEGIEVAEALQRMSVAERARVSVRIRALLELQRKMDEVSTATEATA